MNEMRRDHSLLSYDGLKCVVGEKKKRTKYLRVDCVGGIEAAPTSSPSYKI